MVEAATIDVMPTKAQFDAFEELKRLAESATPPSVESPPKAMINKYQPVEPTADYKKLLVSSSRHV